jgi:predicted metal-binding protein
LNIDKYATIAKKFNIKDILLITPGQIVFDIRAILKCRWGCSYSKNKSIKCETHDISIEERKQIINSYDKIILLHNNNAKELTHACLEIEKELFLDGYYFAFTLRTCNYCDNCNTKSGKECLYPEKVRPCEEMFGIDVYKTITNLGLPIRVLKNKGDVENRYGFVLIE